jgi:Lrp/AsnC family transcriptional regulator, leucine-responsive regulatory protein
MDRIDLEILQNLQQNCRQSIAELADKVRLSASACHRRIKLLEDSGMIRGYAAVLDGKQLGCTIEFFVEISLDSQQGDALEAFEAAVRRIPEVMECYLMTGEADYLLRVTARDTADYEQAYRNKISKLPGVARIQSSLVLRTVREWNGYPVRNTA